MKWIIFSLLVFSDSLKAQIPGENHKTAAALKILDPWHAHQTNEEQRELHFVLWTPNDREAPEGYPVRLTRMMEHIQKFYADEMQRLGFGPRTINLPRNSADQLKIHLIKGLHPESHYEMSSGSEIKNECITPLREQGIDTNKETLVIFCNLAQWDAKKLTFTHKSPYYAGGNHQGGTAWQLDSPELDPKNLALKKPMMSDGQYGRISLGKHNSIFIGGVCHELGHALGLPHCKQRPDEAARGTALMGSGNRTYGDELRHEGKGSFLTLANALRLASHPQFSDSSKGMNLPVFADLAEVKITAAEKTITVSGKLTADPPAYAVIAYFDPEGGGDYNATTATAIPDTQGNFTLSSSALTSGKSGELRLIPLHVNGSTGGWMSQTKFRYPYSIKKDGTPDLTTFQTKQTLAPLIEALRIGDRRRAQALASRLPKGPIAEIAKNIITQGDQPKQKPSEWNHATRKSSLTYFKPSEVKVGWGRPAYNYLPAPSLLLESGGKIFPAGIYAHAPASHRYKLAGKWNTLKGQVGLAAGKRGSVTFKILGDGKTLWQSPTVKEGKLHQFNISLKDIQTLELQVDPTKDGLRSDWGLWLEPTLE
ncbi:NPCBM/NEW2 domain-containing protein [Akkermansiaceae bacterium]|nr:NPCBM/NEW2 domain-containing protein [Akkermansiaceae bacterium]